MHTMHVAIRLRHAEPDAWASGPVEVSLSIAPTRGEGGGARRTLPTRPCSRSASRKPVRHPSPSPSLPCLRVRYMLTRCTTELVCRWFTRVGVTRRAPFARIGNAPSTRRSCPSASPCGSLILHGSAPGPRVLPIRLCECLVHQGKLERVGCRVPGACRFVKEASTGAEFPEVVHCSGVCVSEGYGDASVLQRCLGAGTPHSSSTLTHTHTHTLTASRQSPHCLCAVEQPSVQ